MRRRDYFLCRWSAKVHGLKAAEDIFRGVDFPLDAGHFLATEGRTAIQGHGGIRLGICRSGTSGIEAQSTKPVQEEIRVVDIGCVSWGGVGRSCAWQHARRFAGMQGSCGVCVIR